MDPSPGLALVTDHPGLSPLFTLSRDGVRNITATRRKAENGESLMKRRGRGEEKGEAGDVLSSQVARAQVGVRKSRARSAE